MPRFKRPSPAACSSSSGVMRFDRPDELEQAAGEGRLNLGIDHTALVQEFIPARGGYITRVEVLGYKYLYAIQVFLSGEGYNLCPADICQTTDGVELRRAACPVDAPKTGLRGDGYTPPAEVIAAGGRVMGGAGIEVGGVEDVVGDRESRLLYYDIHTRS